MEQQWHMNTKTVQQLEREERKAPSTISHEYIRYANYIVIKKKRVWGLSISQ